jgi:Cdc6-like AAA superfamily ATPase
MNDCQSNWSSVSESLDPTLATEFRPALKYGKGRYPLCGRTSERDVLWESYKSFILNGTGPTILVRGISGSGKTALVESLLDIVSENQSYFCYGKYFQNSVGGDPCE